jgi:hypothetical protein
LYITITFSLYLYILRPDLGVLLRFYYDFTTTDHSSYSLLSLSGSYIIVLLEYIIALEHNKLFCLRTYINFVIINMYPLDKTSALDQPCYQWCKLLPTVRLRLITKTHTPYTEPPRFNNMTLEIKVLLWDRHT